MAKKKKTKTCKHCGAEMVKTMTVCPNCGGKNPVPITGRLWFWVIVLIVLSALWRAIPSTPVEDADDYTGNVPRSDVEYIDITVDELAEEFHANELRAKDEYIGTYVSVTGRLRVIDDEGKYLCLYPMGYESFDNVHCILMNDDDQLTRLKEYSLDDTVTVKGKITELGDFHDIKLEADCLE